MPTTQPNPGPGAKKPKRGRGGAQAVQGGASASIEPGAPKPKKKIDWLGWSAAVVSGLLGAAAFEPMNLRFLLPLAPLGCFWAMCRAATPWGAFARAWLFGQVFFFCVLQWLTEIRNYAPVPFLAVLAIVALGGYIGLYTGLCAYATRRWFSALGWRGQYCVFAGFWIFQEWFRSLGRLASPLGFLAHAWAPRSLAIQIAAYMGELGVTFEILLCGLLIGILVEWTHRTMNRSRLPLRSFNKYFVEPLAVVLFPAVWIFASYIHAEKLASRAGVPRGKISELHVALAQPNVDQWDKLQSYLRRDNTYEAEMFMRAKSEELTATQIEQVTEISNPGWDLLVLPESAFTQEDFATNEFLRERVATIAQRSGADVFLGANRRKGSGDAEEIYNSAWLVHPDGKYDLDAYDKVRLVPFGEDMPYFDLIPGVASLTGIGEFNIGGKPTIFETHGHKFGALICFESMFASEGRERVRLGAEFLAVITNDGWYGTSAGVAYHHHISALRAVETGRYVLRCANTGITSIFAPWGAALWSLPFGKPGILRGVIEPHDYQTPFVRFGNMWLWLVAAGIGAALVKAKRISRAARAASENEIAQKA